MVTRGINKSEKDTGMERYRKKVQISDWLRIHMRDSRSGHTEEKSLEISPQTGPKGKSKKRDWMQMTTVCLQNYRWTSGPQAHAFSPDL